MRKWVYDKVKSSPLQSGLFNGRIYTTGAGEGDEPGDSPARPFLVIRFSTKDRVTRLPGSRVKQQRVQVWIHTEPGSMIHTDAFAAALEQHLPSQTPSTAPDGEVIIDCEWEDTSGDGYDDHYQTSTRYVVFLVTYREP